MFWYCWDLIFAYIQGCAFAFNVIDFTIPIIDYNVRIPLTISIFNWFIICFIISLVFVFVQYLAGIKGPIEQLNIIGNLLGNTKTVNSYISDYAGGLKNYHYRGYSYKNPKK